jgi:hypothetical protein
MKNLCNKTTAIELLGLTRNSFQKLNIKPEKEIPNPHYKSGPPSQLFDRIKIEKLVGSEKVKALQPKPREAKNYVMDFIKQYKTKEDAIPKACEYLFSLNRYCKYDSCSASVRQEIYNLKHGFVEYLYVEGYAKAVYKHIKAGGKCCYKCDGTGVYFHHYDGAVDCYRCGGTRELDDFVAYVFEFNVAGTNYSWHIPEEFATFQFKLTEASGELNQTEIKEVPLKKREFKKAKELIKWVIT